MRNSMNHLLGGLIMAAVVFAQGAAAEDKLGTGKTALFVYGGWKGHQPVKCRDLFVPWLKAEGFDVKTSDSLDAYLDPNLKNFDLIVQVWTMGKISKEQSKALQDAVNSGVGLAGWHGGLCDAFRENVGYQFMTGGQWVAHPGGDKMVYDVNFISDDPVVKGLNDFKIKSEQYYMHVDPGVTVLATTTFKRDKPQWFTGTVMPVIWKKHFGKGRVFYASYGHTVKDFEIPEAMTALKRGILWASKDR